MPRNSFDIYPEFFIVVDKALSAYMDRMMRKGEANPSLRYEKVSRIHHAYQLNQAFTRAIDEQDPLLIRLSIE